MDFVLKDIFDIRGNLIVNKGTPIDDALLRKLKKHQIERLEVGTVDTAKIAEPVERLMNKIDVKSRMVEYLDMLEPNKYNFGLYTATVTNMLGGWLGLDEKSLKEATNYGMMKSTGLNQKMEFDEEKYQSLVDISESYVNRIQNKGENALQALNHMWENQLTSLDPGLLLLLIRRFSTMLIGSEIEIDNERYKLIYISPTDLMHPIVQKDDGEVKVI